jgi:CRP-like cAMP-binding protein
MHVQPQNLAERAFAIIVVIFALVGFSYIVGSITGSLAQLRNMHAEEAKLFWDLRRYLQKNQVNHELTLRIQKYCEHAWAAKQESKPDKDVKLLQFLSEQLSSELKYELAVSHLVFHPFLAQLCTFSSVTVHRLSNSALEHKLLAEGDRLFIPGEAATHMYIVVKGRLTYRRMVGGGGHEVVERVDPGEDWISEPALWTELWRHLGQLTAVDESDNLAINASKFSEQVKLNPQAYLFTKGYAKNFLDWLNEESFDTLSDISQGEDVGDLCRNFIPIFEQESAESKSSTWVDETGNSIPRSSGLRRLSRPRSKNSAPFFMR